MAEFTIEKSLEIEATAAEIWDQLVDVKSWPSWKPFIKKASVRGGYETVSSGSGINFSLLLGVGAASAPLRVTVVEFDPRKSLAWEGGVRGLVHAIHGFELEERMGKTVVTSRETFSGALLSIVNLLVPREEMEQLHVDWLEAIKDRVAPQKQEEKTDEAHGGHDDHH